MALTAYYLWARRNAYIHTSKFEHPNAIILKVADELNIVWSKVPTNSILQNLLPRSISHDRWQKPLIGSFKIN